MNESILSQKVAQILPLGGSSVLLIFLSSLIGALVGGFAGLAASYLPKWFETDTADTSKED
jgi:NhaP-type Na+/H+ or K+/H+ antiporter